MGRDITKLHPELKAIIPKFLDMCKSANLNVLITETFRTEAEQEALYAKGRTMPGNIVTRARYPQSPHCWGVAFDFCRNVRGKEYDDSDNFFYRVGQIGKSFGLFWGGDFRTFVDKPHFELQKYMPNQSCRWLLQKYGSPDKFIETWETETMTYERFVEYMERYIKERGKLPTSKWAEKELALAKELGITDGTRPRDYVTREEAAIMCERVADILIEIRDAEE